MPDAASSKSTGWLDRVGKLADETMPGLTMAEGIHEAVGLDLPIGDVEKVLARLQQTTSGTESPESETTNPRQIVQVSYEIDGQEHPDLQRRVPELERLIARVRSEGSVVSHSSSVVESLVSRSEPNKSAAPAANVLPAQHVSPLAAVPVENVILPVSYEQPLATSAPTMWRLPPVDLVQ
jgi:hypothetical protein